MTCQKHRPRGQGLTATDLVVANELLLGVPAQRHDQVIELVVELIEPAEVGYDALGGPVLYPIGLDDL